MQHYSFHIGDYIKDTAHLTDSEDLAYRRLLDLYYDTEGHLPPEVSQIARRIRAKVEDAQAVLSEFFYQADGLWKHSRCDQELAKVYEKSEKARANAAASHVVRRAKAGVVNSERKADAMQTHSERKADGVLPVTRNPLPVSKPKAEAQQPATATRLPADWVPSEEDIKFCIKQRRELKPFDVADAFRDYWISIPGAKGRKLNWSATWRNWVRNESGKKAGGGSAPSIVSPLKTNPCAHCGEAGVKRVGQTWYCADHNQNSHSEAA